MTVLMAMSEVSIEISAASTPGANNTNSSCDIRTRNNTDINDFDDDYSRAAFTRYSTTEAGDIDLVNKVAYDSINVLWLHVNAYDRAQAYTPTFRIKDSIGDRFYSIRVTTGISTCTMEVYTYDDADGDEQGVTKLVSDDGTASDFDFALDIANDLVHFYQDGVYYGSEAIDLNRRTGSPIMDRVSLNCNSRTGIAGFSQLILVADEVTIGWKIKDINPDGAGNYTDWTGAYTDINERAYDPLTETTVVGAGTNTYTYDDVQVGIQTDYQVKAILVSTVAAADVAATAPKVQNVLRTNATDYLLGSVVDVEGADNRSAINDYLFVNPDTTAQWTFAEVNAAEFGYASS